jgi:murein DD-endopeptidase MepM/ murein hydrolase activator NlpD
MLTGEALIPAAKAIIARNPVYVLGGKGPDEYDCSGYVRQVLMDVGIVTPIITSTDQQKLWEVFEIEEGKNPPAGSILFRPRAGGKTAHNGVADGLGGVYHAASPEHGVVHLRDASVIGFTHFGLVPQLDYREAAMPVMPVITSYYGWRTVFGARNFHRGMDLRSRLGDDRIAIFSGTVTKVTRGRYSGARVGADSGGIPAHAPSLSGNAITIRRADGKGYYVEVHISPAVTVGQKVTAAKTKLGVTDLSGSITAAHRHVELWKEDDYQTYFDPTVQIRDAFANPKGWPTKATLPKGWVRSQADALRLARKAGYGSVLEYQKGQYRCGIPLVADGVWGAKTEAHHREVRVFQELANKQSGTDLVVDGDYGAKSRARDAELHKRWGMSQKYPLSRRLYDRLGHSSGVHNHD